MKNNWWKRALSLFLALVMCLGMAPLLEQRASAASARALDEYAAPATEEEFNNVNRWFTSNNRVTNFFKIINGNVYAWGQNSESSLGLTSYTNAAGEVKPVVQGTIVDVPTPMPEGTFDSKVKLIHSKYNAAVAVTENNTVYCWGMWLPSSMGLNPAWGGSSNTVEPQIVPLPEGVGDIDFCETSGYSITLHDTDGNWYFGGKMENGGAAVPALLGIDPSTATYGTKYPIQKLPQVTLDSLGTDATGTPRTIEQISLPFSSRAYIVTNDGHLFAYGIESTVNNHCLGTGRLNGTSLMGVDMTVKSEGDLCPMEGRKIVYVTGDDVGNAAVDSDGNVWVWGANWNYRFGPSTNATPANDGSHSGEGTNARFLTPYMVFNTNIYGTRAVRVYTSDSLTVALCENNTVYVVGKNVNGFCTSVSGGQIDVMTQVLKSISEQATIVGTFPGRDGVMAITKSGDMLYTGSNATGGAGNGQSGANADADNVPGSVTTVTNSSLPPSEPLTANELIFEIEVEENGKTFRYRPDKLGVNSYTKTVGTTVTTGQKLTLGAGVTFKLNVYFNDFGKVNTFLIPVRFDPTLVEVVNGAGKAYSSTGLVTPGAIGSSVGIEQCFDTQSWPNGALAVGLKDGGYPKISNATGFVSVAGYTWNKTNPVIQGEVKMFSINFRAKTTSDAVKFEWATENNCYVADPSGATYDEGALVVDDTGEKIGYWSIINPSDSGGEAGYFDFNGSVFPTFASKLVPLKALDMELLYGDNNAEVTTRLDSDAPVNPGWEINWTNKDLIYTLNSKAFADTQKTQTGVSFPQVGWSYEPKFTGDPDYSVEVSDYLTIVDEQDGLIKFKINPSFLPPEDDAPVYVKFTATGKYYSAITTTYYVCLRSYDPPEDLNLGYEVNGAFVDIPTNGEVVYHYTDDESENKKFMLDFGGATENLEVEWSLMDSGGNAILANDPDAKLTFTATTDPSTKVGHAVVTPRYTTPGEDYVVLRASSMYDPTVYDEVKIKIQLYATQIAFNPNLVRMAVEKDGVQSSINLAPYVQVRPVDVYDTNYTYELLTNDWQEAGDGFRKPANYDPEVHGEISNFVYGSLGTGSTAATFTAYEWATPKKDEDHEEAYVTVRVTDTLSGEYDDVKIAIMDLNSPIGISEFVPTNNVGYANDKLFIKSGLHEGDIVRFYNSYEDAVDGALPYNTVTVVNGMFPSFEFTVGNNSGGLMNGEGGCLAVTIERKEDGAADAFLYDPIPVQYGAEPSTVDGYIHLFGKENGSIMDQGIRVDFEGLNFKETVYTNKDGYFKFTKYIAPGNYTMTVSKKNYLTRYIKSDGNGNGGIDIVVNEKGEFHISTQAQPILLFPGELTNDNAITVQDITLYVANWVGRYDDNITDYDSYDFLEDGLISLKDLELILMRKDWVSGSYPVWNVPKQ